MFQILKAFVFVFLNALCFLLWCGFAAADQNGDVTLELKGEKPNLYFSHATYHFGQLYRGQKVSHNFVFQNRGDGQLIFGSIHAACGCMNARILGSEGKKQKNVFLPGESGIVHIDFDTKQFRGAVTRTITLGTNQNQSAPAVSLYLKASIAEELIANPPLIYIGHVESGDQKKYIFNVDFVKTGSHYSNAPAEDWLLEIGRSRIARAQTQQIMDDNSPLHIVALESSLPYLHGSIQKISSHRARVTLSLDPSQSLPIGTVRGNVILWNNSKYSKRFEIPVLGRSLGHVDVDSKYIEFGVVALGKTSEKSLGLESSKKDFRISNIDVSLKKTDNLSEWGADRFFKVDIQKKTTSRAGSRYQIHFLLRYPNHFVPKKSDSGEFHSVNVSGNFIITTNDPETPKLSIPFFGLLKRDDTETDKS